MSKNIKKSENKRKGTFWMLGGLLLLVAALFLTIYNIQEDNQAGELADTVSQNLIDLIEKAKKENQSIMDGENIAGNNTQAETTNPDADHEAGGNQFPVVEEIPDYVKYPEMEMPSYEIDGNRYIGVLEIPDLNLVLPVIGDGWSDAKLKIAPCRYSGSIYQDNLIVAGHNYTRHFGRLRSLPVGSRIHFVDAAGNRFTYEIGWVEILNGTAVEEMSSGEDWELTLFTCVYSGRQRYTIRCIRVD